MSVSKPLINFVDIEQRLLLGPGPGNAHPRVHAAMSIPQIGHMDPLFLTLCDEIKQMLRYVWHTDNEFTLPISGTGSAAWETCVANLTEPGDKHLVFVNGYFGLRHCDIASRYDAEVIRVDKPWGNIFTLDEIENAIKTHRPSLVWIAHAETSTGTLQPMEGIGDICHKYNSLLLVDTVTSIGGIPIYLDKWNIDATYAGTQKCLSCPPGISLISMNKRALNKISSRTTPVKNWYLDLTMIQKYLFAEPGNTKRVYHHTAPISMIYALREALKIIYEVGLEHSWEKHNETAEYLWSKLETIGLSCFVDKEYRLPSLTTVTIPDNVDGIKVINILRERFQIEIGAGLGELAGKVWRIGMMGYNSRKDNVLTVTCALNEAISESNTAHL